MVDLEQLAEDIRNEADELDSVVQHLKSVEKTTLKSFDNIIDNLKYYSDLVYNVYEDDTLQNIDNIKDLNNKLIMILKDTISFNDLVYYCSKYNIDRELFW
jgi:hypothetical protein